MPNTCEHCGIHFEPKWPGAGRFCSRACYNAAGRGPTKSVTKDQRKRTARGHPLAPPSGIVAVSRLVLYDKIGPGAHSCHWCGQSVSWQVGGGAATAGNLLADHLNWDRQDNSPENLVPSCNPCNAHRTRNGDRRRLGDDELTVVWSGRRTRAIERVCERCGEPFLIPPSAAKDGNGRFCSRACLWARPR